LSPFRLDCQFSRHRVGNSKQRSLPAKSQVKML
jgi:hypothetical protein